ncbi:MAG: hypothetical protein ACOY7L_21390 [Pseudomonadota bacterium]
MADWAASHNMSEFGTELGFAGWQRRNAEASTLPSACVPGSSFPSSGSIRANNIFRPDLALSVTSEICLQIPILMLHDKHRIWALSFGLAFRHMPGQAFRVGCLSGLLTNSILFVADAFGIGMAGKTSTDPVVCRYRRCCSAG